MLLLIALDGTQHLRGQGAVIPVRTLVLPEIVGNLDVGIGRLVDRTAEAGVFVVITLFADDLLVRHTKRDHHGHQQHQSREHKTRLHFFPKQSQQNQQSQGAEKPEKRDRRDVCGGGGRTLHLFGRINQNHVIQRHVEVAVVFRQDGCDHHIHENQPHGDFPRGFREKHIAQQKRDGQPGNAMTKQVKVKDRALQDAEKLRSRHRIAEVDLQIKDYTDDQHAQQKEQA